MVDGGTFWMSSNVNQWDLVSCVLVYIHAIIDRNWTVASPALECFWSITTYSVKNEAHIPKKNPAPMQSQGLNIPLLCQECGEFVHLIGSFGRRCCWNWILFKQQWLHLVMLSRREIKKSQVFVFDLSDFLPCWELIVFVAYFCCNGTRKNICILTCICPTLCPDYIFFHWD